MRKAYENGTYVPGAYVMQDKLGAPLIAERTEKLNRAGQQASYREDGFSIDGVLTVQRAGEPLWQRARPTSRLVHFAKEAGKRRALANMRAQGKTLADLKKAGLPLAAFADPKDIKMVPLYRGLNARLANLIRANMRRDERRRVA
jgi:hypothetical protein